MTDDKTTDLLAEWNAGARRHQKAYERRQWVRVMLALGYDIERTEHGLLATPPNETTGDTEDRP